MEKLVWILPQKKYLNSGITKYNLDLIKILEKKYDIKKIYIRNSKNIFENLINKFFYINFDLYKNKDKNSILFVPEEGLGFIIIFVKKLFKKKILIVHDIKSLNDFSKKPKELFKFFFLKINYLFFESYDYVITVSNVTKKNLKRISVQSFIIHNLFHKIKNYQNKNYFNTLNKNKKKVLLNIGSEHSFKNISTILKSMQFLKEYIFIKVGDPISRVNREKNINIVKEYKLENRVIFLNKVNEKKLNSLLKYSDIYLAPSFSEGFGRTTIEAQMYFKKIICANISINKEVLSKTVEYVKDYKNPKAWSNKIIKVKKIKNDLYKKNYNKYLFDNNKKNYLNLLDRLINS
jgi:hypothetical protein